MRIRLWFQVGVIVALFGAAAFSLWRAGASGFDRERRRGEIMDHLAEADDALAESGVPALALVPEWPQALDPEEWAALDAWLSGASVATLDHYQGVEGGFYVPSDDRYLGYAASEWDLGTYTPRSVRRRTSEPPPREYDLVEAQVRKALDTEEPVSILAEAPGGAAVVVRAGPIWVNGRKVAASWALDRLDESRSLDHAMKEYRRAAGLALAGITLALVLSGGLARTVKRQALERVRMQAELRRSERLAALGKLLAGVAHEVRNPLAGIRSTAQLWQRGIGPDPDSIGDVVAEVDRLENIVSRLLQFSKADIQDLRPGDLNLVVAEAARLIRFPAEERGIAVTMELASELPPVAMVPGTILQVLRNLTTNALQAMPSDGILGLRTRYDPARKVVEVHVTDNGPGLSEEIRDHLFEPFFTTREDGTGLGLAIAREIALGHGGNLEVTDRGGEPGAAFVLTLPALPVTTRTSPAKPAPLEELPVG